MAMGSHATEQERVNVVKHLLAANPGDIDRKSLKYERTPLSYAAESGKSAIVPLLLQVGQAIDAESRNVDGRTPLSYAAEEGHSEVVKLLAQSGRVDVDSKDDWGCTPLSKASFRRHPMSVRLLLSTSEAVNQDLKDRDIEGMVNLLLYTFGVEEGWTDSQLRALVCFYPPRWRNDLMSELLQSHVARAAWEMNDAAARTIRGERLPRGYVHSPQRNEPQENDFATRL